MMRSLPSGGSQRVATGPISVSAPLRLFTNTTSIHAEIWGGGARHQQAVLTILLGDSEMESHCCIKERNHSRTLVLGSCLGNRGWDSAKCRQRKRPCRKGDGERIKTQDKIEDDSM